MDEVLRTLDKATRIGIKGVIELLSKPRGEFGAGLDRFRAEWVGSFVETVGATNEETIANMHAWFNKATTIQKRFRLIAILEGVIAASDGQTKWDHLLDMPTNDDNTWSTDNRPLNIAWALDDITDVMTASDTLVRDFADRADSMAQNNV